MAGMLLSGRAFGSVEQPPFLLTVYLSHLLIFTGSILDSRLFLPKTKMGHRVVHFVYFKAPLVRAKHIRVL